MALKIFSLSFFFVLPGFFLVVHLFLFVGGKQLGSGTDTSYNPAFVPSHLCYSQNRFLGKYVSVNVFLS